MSQDDFSSKDDPATASLLPGGHYDSAAVARAKNLIDTMPDRIGRYRILERLGGGGMGEVYVAEQTEPIKRRVALKVIKAGMDTRQVVARFEAERQALAMMDHPNIARVIDAGATETGQPYFVMELVRGIPITQFADANKLSTRQRVELMVPVCQAVQHAHQKGIIHRDIKPHNVLVTLHDGKPVPKVIDFGIAKATSQLLTDKTVYTEFRAMIGTPAYMSPEQAEMSGLDIDTRSDIYSLGVLAYELLTGSPPFDSERLVKAGLGEIQRIIREEEPARPSIRLSTLGERLTTVATSRSTEPARLSKLVAGELDWIVMRAMEKDRKRRYDTATDLAADLSRHLNGEPVEAAPPTWVYRARKFARKNQGAVITAAAVTVALLLGVTATTVMSIEAHRQASRANQAATREAARADSETKARDAAELEAYVADLAIAQSEMASNNYSEARVRLNACPLTKRGWEWDFLQKPANIVLTSFPLDTESADFNRDGTRLVTRSEKGTVTLWDPRTGETIGHPIEIPHTFNVDEIVSGESSQKRPALRCAVFNENGTRLLVVIGVQAQLIDAKTGESIGKPLFLSWNKARFDNPYTEEELAGGQMFASFNSDGTKFILWDKIGAHAFDANNGSAIGADIKPAKGITAGNVWSGRCWMSDDGSRALVSSGFSRWQIWDTLGGVPICPRFLSHGYPDPRLNGRCVISTSEDNLNSVAILDLATGKPIGKPVEQATLIRAVYGGDGSIIITTSDNETHVWNAQNGEHIATLPRSFVGSSQNVVFSPQAARCLIRDNHAFRLYDTSTWQQIGNQFGGHLDITPSFNSEGSRFLVEWAGHGIRLYDANDAKELCEPLWQQYNEDQLSAEFMHDGKHVLVEECWDSKNRVTYCLWSTNGTLCGRIQAGPQIDPPASWAKQSPDGRLVAVKRDDKVMIVLSTNFDHWIDDLEDPEFIDVQIDAANEDASKLGLRQSSGEIQEAPLIPGEGYVELHSNVDNSILRIGDGSKRFDAVTMSPDCRRLVAGGAGTVTIYECKTGKELISFRQSKSVKALSFTPDGSRLIFRFVDGTAQIWDPRPIDERQKTWAKEIVERTAAREYIDRLWGGPIEISRLNQSIREDRTITSLRRLVAMEEIDQKVEQLNDEADGLFANMTKKFPLRAKIREAIEEQSTGRLGDLLRTKLAAWTIEDEYEAADRISDGGCEPDVSNEDRDLALSAANACLAHNPKDSRALKALGAIQYRLGHFEDALRILRTLETDQSASTYDREDIWSFIAMADFRLGKFDESRHALKNALPLRGNSGRCNEAAALIDPATTRPAGTQPVTRP